MPEKILVLAANRHQAARWAEKTETPDTDYVYVETVDDIRGRITTYMPRVITRDFHQKPGAQEILSQLEIYDLAVRL